MVAKRPTRVISAQMTDATKGAAFPPMGERRFGRVNWRGLWTLYAREVRRFFKVWAQTLVAPVITAGLFMAVFTLALAERRGDVAGLPFAAFLAPGIVMMAVIQNAFANASSSITSAKVQGNIVDVLMPPLSPGELTAAYALGGVTRGLTVAALSILLIFPFIGLGVEKPLWTAFFAFTGALILALVGTMGGVWAEKFDHISTVTNFVITPLSFLSGTFYLVDELPAPWDAISRWNPVHYMIDGFRYGVLGTAERDPWIGAAVLTALAVALWWACLRMLASGYRLKS